MFSKRCGNFPVGDKSDKLSTDACICVVFYFFVCFYSKTLKKRVQVEIKHNKIKHIGTFGFCSHTDCVSFPGVKTFLSHNYYEGTVSFLPAEDDVGNPRDKLQCRSG